ncbi:MAG: prepilin-type N-terminal cleavage/methylation domain-containing protein [Actinomycetota bacterium]
MRTLFAKFHALREKNDERGFTLIELLVVILIIAILAAIAIPVFLRQREKGWVSQVESALKGAQTAAESYATGPGDGDYAGLNRAALDTEGLKVASDVTLADADVTLSADGLKYCIEATHANLAGRTWGISSDSTTPREGTCAAGVFTAAP